jgi:hypothetical protein
MEKSCDACEHHFMDHKRCNVMSSCNSGSEWKPVPPIMGVMKTQGAFLTEDGHCYLYHGPMEFAIPNPNFVLPTAVFNMEDQFCQCPGLASDIELEENKCLACGRPFDKR